jgi:ApaG protein
MIKADAMYRAVTQGIEITVDPFYIEEESAPEDNR